MVDEIGLLWYFDERCNGKWSYGWMCLWKMDRREGKDRGEGRAIAGVVSEVDDRAGVFTDLLVIFKLFFILLILFCFLFYSFRPLINRL